MNRCFDHEKLEVYQESPAFVAWLEPLLLKMTGCTTEIKITIKIRSTHPKK
jgi:hypothetical protein